uniref:Cytochrome c biogenesis protein Ccs1 n=1 Tax=Bostrychia moritziana TaxID=103713 RepID=A0A1Z1M668_BOSMO|nr:cytochrome c biogenesis protein ccs1 [Bostrychia moritziana]ARW61588.1 cytochrome c biogenesis protein ccs1 [Bostrychia moritziana]
MNIKYFYKRNVLWNILKIFSNLNLAIFILFLVAFFSMIGSVVEQNQSLSYYQVHYPVSTNFFSWKFICFWGLDNIYQAWWFILVLFLLTFSLISCTFSTQLPAFKHSRRWKFFVHQNSKNSNYSFAQNKNIHENSLANMIYSLVLSNFFVFHKKNFLYSYKGLYGRIAPIFVHLGIIIIILGSVLGFLFGFVSQEIVPVGETFHMKNIVRSGFYSNFSLDLITRVEKFYITYYPNSSIKQFFSQLSLLFKNKIVVRSRSIFVNSPLVFNGITFYQTDWQINALRFKLGSGLKIQKKLTKANINNSNCWLCNFWVGNDCQVFFIVFGLDNSIVLCNENGGVIDSVFVGETFYINNVPVSVTDVMTSTGLQIKKDPGIFFVYLGFFMVILSTFISYLSYSQVWVLMHLNNCKFIGSTNRAILFFEEDISFINRNYNKYTLTQDLVLFNLINQVLR